MPRFAYGVTTVPERRETILPRTLASLRNAGFDQPRLFVDGTDDIAAYRHFGLPVSVRFPKLRVAGNWMLSMWELYVSNPNAERFVMFQDDCVAVKNLRAYLDKVPYPENAYLNLYAIGRAVQHLPADAKGFQLSDQRGRGAVGLVFSRAALTKLFANDHFVCRIQDEHRGWRLIDGGIVTALKNVGWKEYVHCPSLVDHIGHESTWKGDISKQWYSSAVNFPGEDFDAMSLL